MTERTQRPGAGLLEWLRGTAIAALTWAGMALMGGRPPWFVVVLALLGGFVAVASAEVGVLIALVALSLPVLAVNLALGVGVLVLALVAEYYVGGRGAGVFILAGVAFVGALFGPVWAAAVLAGYLLGPSEGALAAAFMCLVLEVSGALAGQPALGVLTAGGTLPAALSFAHAPATLVSAAWFFAGLKSVPADASAVAHSLTHITGVPFLLAQMGTWAAAAAGVGALTRRSARQRSLLIALAGVAAGVVALAAADAALRPVLGAPFSPASTALALVTSLIAVLIVATVRETLFAPMLTKPVASATPATVSTEDADVDELLRLIATAEDKLASQHTADCIVLITDMKAFSRMTEEDGSVATAKAIQRHRDLLVPIVTRNHGNGKSTGGDGVVAAFGSAADAVQAAIEGQQALTGHNATHPNERELLVRMGIASGEVVLDKSGRPFIGAGLNLAARVMTLADAGQILATAEVVSAAGGKRRATLHSQSFGLFELKNIARPVEIAEVLWADGQLPRDPRAQQPSA